MGDESTAEGAFITLQDTLSYRTLVRLARQATARRSRLDSEPSAATTPKPPAGVTVRATLGNGGASVGEETMGKGPVVELSLMTRGRGQ